MQVGVTACIFCTFVGIMKKKHIIIAVDGYSSCGKSTFARRIARELSILYIDSGAMYRAFTLYCLENGIEGEHSPDFYDALKNVRIDFTDNQYPQVRLNDRNVERKIRMMKVSERVSDFSKIVSVRHKMVQLQRKMANNQSIVMDGRDIGTVVFPDADLKIFMTADPGIRAERRFKELKQEFPGITLKEVEVNIRERDYIDENRDESPLRKAEDALVLDNSHMSVEEQMIWFWGVYTKHIGEIA